MEFNVGLIGYGMSGAVFHAPIITHTPGLCLKAVVSSDETKVQKDYPGMLVYPDIKNCFADDSIDLIVISTPNTTHYDFAKQALLAGKHVVVEKPFTVNSTEAEDLIALAKEKKSSFERISKPPLGWRFPYSQSIAGRRCFRTDFDLRVTL